MTGHAKNYTKPKTKVCGITQSDNMLAIAELRPDYMGFIFYEPSVRDVSNRIHTMPLKDISAGIQKVAVTVNKPLEEAKELILQYGFDMVQLHGQESPGYCHRLSQLVPVIKSFSVGNRLPDNLEDYDSACHFFLFDTLTDKPGGSGKSFDHGILDSYNGKPGFFLSGGISPHFHLDHLPGSLPALHALDINSRFEIRPGIKDVGLVKAFLDKIQKIKSESTPKVILPQITLNHTNLIGRQTDVQGK